MGEIIDSAISEFATQSDDFLMRRYTIQATSPYPSTVEMIAIEAIFLERDITFEGIDNLVYFKKNGEKTTIKTKKI